MTTAKPIKSNKEITDTQRINDGTYELLGAIAMLTAMQDAMEAVYQEVSATAEDAIVRKADGLIEITRCVIGKLKTANALLND